MITYEINTYTAYEINTYIDVSSDTAAVKKKNIVNFFCQ